MPTRDELIFRRYHDSSTWHFHLECTRWPKKGYVESAEPKEGTACPECAHRAGVKCDARYA